jgi:hypothetical protein
MKNRDREKKTWKTLAPDQLARVRGGAVDDGETPVDSVFALTPDASEAGSENIKRVKVK